MKKFGLYVYVPTLTLLIGGVLAGGFSFVENTLADNDNTKSILKNVIPDTAITAAIKSKYLAEKQISSQDIHVETINGQVILSGKIQNNIIKEQVETIARNTKGVIVVVSKLEILP